MIFSNALKTYFGVIKHLNTDDVLKQFKRNRSIQTKIKEVLYTSWPF